MKRLSIVVVVVGALAGLAWVSGLVGGTAGPGTEEAPGGPAGTGPQAGGGGRGRGAQTGPMTVEIAAVVRGSVAQQLVVVGNLIGDSSVAVVPRAAGRLQDIAVRLGDQVTRGQRIAKIEDFELQQQVRQQEAALEVSQATIRQREADLQLAETNAERSRNLFARQLLPRQTLDDTEARYQAAVAQLDLARAQNNQSSARLEELRINLANTIILSPVNGFIARRNADPGASVGPNLPLVDVVDIGRVRMVANVVEKDLTQIQTGDDTRVEVDAFPGEVFVGRIARVAPVLDPATRTAPIEIEIPNPGFLLKPGMYARVSITTDDRRDALVVPSSAVIDLGGRRGVFLADGNDVVSFRPVTVGIEDQVQVEILAGLAEGDRVVSNGARALRDGDRVQPADPDDGVLDATSLDDGPSGPAGGRRGGDVGGQRGGGRGSRGAAPGTTGE